jgi:hypothetical protein
MHDIELNIQNEFLKEQFFISYRDVKQGIQAPLVKRNASIISDSMPENNPALGLR